MILPPHIKIYQAPLQGLTDWIFREAYSQVFEGIDQYYSPYIKVKNSQIERKNRFDDILPTKCLNHKPIPQFLGNCPDSFLFLCDKLSELGYDEININFGCPYPMVTKRGFGAGILETPEKADAFLNTIFKKSSFKISIKTRLGNNSADEFDRFVPILNSYPITETIIHPRIAKQLYKGTTNKEKFKIYAEQLNCKVGYNGDINMVKDIDDLSYSFHLINSISLGRGIIAKPYLPALLQGKELDKNELLKKLNSFHEKIIHLCKERYATNGQIIKRMTEFWEYFSQQFNNEKKVFKGVKKSRTLEQYHLATSLAFTSGLK